MGVADGARPPGGALPRPSPGSSTPTRLAAASVLLLVVTDHLDHLGFDF